MNGPRPTPGEIGDRPGHPAVPGDVVLGTGGIGGIAAATGPGLGLSEHQGHELITRAVAEGVRVLDTADVYTGGTSERVVGDWARAHPDAGVLLQTKTGLTGAGPDLSPQRLRRQVDHGVQVLGRVDLFLTHCVDPATPWSASLPVLSDAVQDGSIGGYGLSNVDGPTLTDALETADRLGLVRPVVVQNSYSLIVRVDDAEVLPVVASEGLAYTPYSPLATGVLAGRYSGGERPGPGDRASIASRAEDHLADPELMERVRAFDSLAAGLGVSSAGLALAWLLNHPLVTAPIIGPSKERHWSALAEARELPWSTALDSQLTAVFP